MTARKIIEGYLENPSTLLQSRIMSYARFHIWQ